MSVAVRTPFQVGRPQHDGLRVSARLSGNGHTADVFFVVADGPVAAAPEAWTAVALAPAMVHGSEVRVEGSLSPEHLAALAKIQDLFHAWESWCRIVPVESEPARSTSAPLGTGVGCFFSGGLDSFYTVLKRRREITELIFVHGFDIALENRELRARVVQALRSAAAELGKPLLEVETNVRAFTDRYFNWGACHLAAQAAVAYVLAPRFRRIYVPSTHPDEYYTDGSIASGSHPSLPALWSTEQVELVQDGGEAGRVAKARAISGHDVVLKTLRVCWWNPGGAYNCCRCEKCLLTMVALRAVGVLERCETFPQELSLQAVAGLSMGYDSSRFFMTENLRALEESGRDPELVTAVRTCLEREA